MVIVQLNGGMGNQLFQYAAGLSLSLYYDKPLKVDVSAFDKKNIDTKRSLELLNFNINPVLANFEELKVFLNQNLLQKLYSKMNQGYKNYVYKEPHFHFDKNFFNTRQNVFLKGYWQSEKYFAPYKPAILKSFTVRDELINSVKPFIEELNSNETVALHVRRKDYLQPITMDFHGVLSADYYNAAIKRIKEQVINPVFVVFSDDINWVKQNFNFNATVHFVDESISSKSITDFYLISQCKHQVIANSSFSWWAAYLNPNPDKIVIAPQRWFNKAPYDTKDLIPEDWIRI